MKLFSFEKKMNYIYWLLWKENGNVRYRKRINDTDSVPTVLIWTVQLN